MLKNGSVCPICGSRLELREVNYWKDRMRVAIMLQRTFGLYGEDTVMYTILQTLESRNYPSEERFRRAYELLQKRQAELRVA